MDILKIHNMLEEIYNHAERLKDTLISKNFKVTLASYNRHVINIEGKLYEQKYYMPVITVDNIGDICFNMNSIEFEFYVTKEDFDDINLNKLLGDYRDQLQIYEYEDCLKDIYKIGDSKEEVIRKVSNSKDDKFGVSIDVTNLSDEEIIEQFKIVANLLNKK